MLTRKEKVKRGEYFPDDHQTAYIAISQGPRA